MRPSACRNALILGSWLSCACGERNIRRTIPRTAAETEVTATQNRVAESSWGHRQGRWDVPSISAAVGVKWTTHLGAPITRPLGLVGTDAIVVSGGNLGRYSPDGVKKWTTTVRADGVAREFSDGINIATENGVMYIINPENGELESAVGGTHSIMTAPLEVGSDVVWVDSEGVLHSKNAPPVDLLDGPVSDAATDGKHIVVGNIHGEVVAGSPDGRAWTHHGPAPIIAHPALHKGIAFVPFSAKDGIPGGIIALELSSGARVWTSHIGFEPGGAPAVGKHLIVPGKSGELVALDIGHGGVRWRAPGSGSFTMQPLVVENTVLAGDATGRLQLVDMDDGGTIWTLDIGSPLTGEGVITEGIIIVGTADGRLIGIGP